MRVLLTGGLGFIGSHTALVLSNMNFEVIIIDNLYNSKITVLDNIKILSKHPDKIMFFKGDITIKTDALTVFSKYSKIDVVIHFASLKSVNDSISLPLLYYKKNLMGMINLLEVMEICECNKLIFSSSATVYGSNQKSPLNEEMNVGFNITNPYGQTKYFQEQILNDSVKANEKLCVVILRYFNPVGAHPSGMIGEDPNGIPTNLFPFLLKVISKKYDELCIFGHDYDTPDGTCVRDFVHVMDLADGHSQVISHMNKPGIETFNLGTRKGTSVLELINTFQKVNNISVPYKFLPRREGDVDVLYSDTSKIYDVIGWKSKYTLEDICRDGYNYLIQKNQTNNSISE